MPIGTAVHSRTFPLCESLNYREWSGFYAVSAYEAHHDHEYNAIRNAAALIELAALATAREFDCKHEWAAHLEHAQKAGIPLETIRLIHQKKEPQLLAFEDAQIVSFVQELLRSHRVSEATFQALYGRLGERGLVELTATVGYYAMLACTLNAFDVATVSAPAEFKI